MRRRTRPLSRREFVASLDAYKLATRQLVVEALQRIAFDCAENIIVGGTVSPGTPVDTGFARASWWIALNNFAGGGSLPTASIDASGVSSLTAGLSVISAAQLGDVIYILNNVPYVIELEFGSSQQAPSGFVRLTLAAAPEITRRAVQVVRGNA